MGNKTRDLCFFAFRFRTFNSPLQIFKAVIVALAFNLVTVSFICRTVHKDPSSNSDEIQLRKLKKLLWLKNILYSSTSFSALNIRYNTQSDPGPISHIFLL